MKKPSPLPVCKHRKSMNKFTRRHDQANIGKSGFEAKRDWVLGALHSLQSEKKLSAEKRGEMHFVSNEEYEKWIAISFDRATAVARQPVHDA